MKTSDSADTTDTLTARATEQELEMESSSSDHGAVGLAVGTGTLDSAANEACEISRMLDLAARHETEALRIALVLAKVLTRL